MEPSPEEVEGYAQRHLRTHLNALEKAQRDQPPGDMAPGVVEQRGQSLHRRGEKALHRTETPWFQRGKKPLFLVLLLVAGGWFTITHFQSASLLVDGDNVSNRLGVHWQSLSPWGLPEYDYLVIRPAYMYGFVQNGQMPRWIAYQLGSRGAKPEKKQLRVDPELEGFRVQPIDGATKQAGYVFGALLPPSHASGLALESEDLSYYSIHVLMAESLPISLWKQSGNHAPGFRDTWVLAGPVYWEKVPAQAGVRIPSHFFRVFVRLEEEGAPSVMAFLVPNQSINQADIETFLVSIDQIEHLTGLDLLSDLADESLESAITTLWP